VSTQQCSIYIHDEVLCCINEIHLSHDSHRANLATCHGCPYWEIRLNKQPLWLSLARQLPSSPACNYTQILSNTPTDAMSTPLPYFVSLIMLCVLLILRYLHMLMSGFISVLAGLQSVDSHNKCLTKKQTTYCKVVMVINGQ
jgi:hypothetical protein